MTVRAQEHAFPSLLADLIECPGDPAVREAKGFLPGIGMMKLERVDAAVVSTQLAPAARFFNENRLHLAASPHYRLSPTAFAVKSVLRANNCKLGFPVAGARTNKLPQALSGGVCDLGASDLGRLRQPDLLPTSALTPAW